MALQQQVAELSAQAAAWESERADLLLRINLRCAVPLAAVSVRSDTVRVQLIVSKKLLGMTVGCRLSNYGVFACRQSREHGRSQHKGASAVLAETKATNQRLTDLLNLIALVRTTEPRCHSGMQQNADLAMLHTALICIRSKGSEGVLRDSRVSDRASCRPPSCWCWALAPLSTP